MGLGRRGTAIDDDAAWVFNRMADVYDARPPYPRALIDALHAIAISTGGHVLDLAAGTGHVSLPLAQRGLSVTAVEPARAMLERLRQRASHAQVDVRALHAAAEAVPIDAASVDTVVIADALHFLDAEQTGAEIARVLRPRGALAIVTSELGRTPFMCAVIEAMEAAAPRRPRAIDQTQTQVAALCGITLGQSASFEDATAVGEAQLEAILRSISFIGPAMNPQRFSAFFACIRAIEHAPIWSRRFTLRSGRR